MDSVQRPDVTTSRCDNNAPDDARILVLEELRALHASLDFIQKEVEFIKKDVVDLQTRILSTGQDES